MRVGTKGKDERKKREGGKRERKEEGGSTKLHKASMTREYINKHFVQKG